MLTKLENNSIVEYNFKNFKKVILCGVPGAFTPGCTKKHLPGFANNLNELESKGIDKVVFVATNDAYVMDAWNTHHGHKKIDCVSDFTGEFSKSIDELIDHGPDFGKRCNRFALLIEHGNIIRKFKNPFIEDILKEL